MTRPVYTIAPLGALFNFPINFHSSIYSDDKESHVWDSYSFIHLR